MSYVRIDNIQDGQIFQHTDGWADIEITGTVDERGEQPGAVYAYLVREYNGTWATPMVQAQIDGDRYRALLRAPLGGLYTLRVTYWENGIDWMPANGEVRFHLGVGDLWVIAGQSNSVGYGRQPCAERMDERVRLMGLSRHWRNACHPLSDGAKYACTPVGEGFTTGVSPYVSFGDELVRELNYPIGLLQTAQGGMSMTVWDKGALLYDNILSVVHQAGGKVRGFLWYQGCSDTDREEDAERYLERFSRFVSNMRQDLSDPQLPFLIVQLNKFVGDPAWNHRWALVKEAQRQAMLTMNNVYTVASHDAALSDYVHNSSAGQQIIGRRLAYLAFEKVYGLPYLGLCPDVAGIQVKGFQVAVDFSNAHQGFIGGLPPLDRCDFSFEDDLGTVPIQSYEMRSHSFIFQIARKPEGTLLCSFSPYCLNSGLLPVETVTGAPPLAFYRVPAKAVDA